MYGYLLDAEIAKNVYRNVLKILFEAKLLV